MKKHSILIGVLSIAFSALFLVFTSGAKAETQDGEKKDLVTVLHLVAPSLLGPKDTSVEKKDSEINPLRTLIVPMKEGLNAFVDITSPRHPGLTPKDNTRSDYRAVFGFHFRL